MLAEEIAERAIKVFEEREKLINDTNKILNQLKLNDVKMVYRLAALLYKSQILKED